MDREASRFSPTGPQATQPGASGDPANCAFPINWCLMSVSALARSLLREAAGNTAEMTRDASHDQEGRNESTEWSSCTGSIHVDHFTSYRNSVEQEWPLFYKSGTEVQRVACVICHDQDLWVQSACGRVLHCPGLIMAPRVDA